MYLGGGLPQPIPGYRMRVLDGNHLAATQHRLKETRDNSAAPLPGQSLCVYEPAWQMVTDILLCEDGHAQERSLLEQVVAKLRERDLWLADRNFCVKWFLLVMAKRGGFFIIREHMQLNYCKAGKLRRRGRVETGQVLEQSICLVDDEDGKEYFMRRVVVRLDEPTCEGDWELALITNLPDEVTAKTVADTSRQRWTIDESQSVAKAYQAACTPDFFGFDKGRRLIYRGQMDDSRPGNSRPNDGADLRAALDAVLVGLAPAEQKPSVGCNIKWKPGNEPAY